MRQLIPLATSLITVIGMWMAGNQKWQAWLLGLCNQLLWGWFIVVFHAWGLVPLSACLIVVYTRNLIRWRKTIWT